jgi:hypothetical protein
LGFAYSRAAVSIASTCRCVRPSVGDSAGTVGRRTNSAGGALQHAVDDAGSVEAGQHQGPPGHRGRLEPASLLHPPHVQLQMLPLVAPAGPTPCAHGKTPEPPGRPPLPAAAAGRREEWLRRRRPAR